MDENEELKNFRYHHQQKTSQEKNDVDLAKSKNIGMKMLLKMGYKPGEGLGAKGQGIKEPIPIEIIPKNAGLGSTNVQIDVKKSKKPSSVSDSSSSSEANSESESISEIEEPSHINNRWNYHHTILADSEYDRLGILQKLEALQAQILNLLPNANNKSKKSKDADKYLLNLQLNEYREYNQQLDLMQLEKKALLQVVREAKKRAVLKTPIDIKTTYESIFRVIEDAQVKLAILLALLPKSAEDSYDTLLWIKEELPGEYYQKLFEKMSFLRAVHKDLGGKSVKERLEGMLSWKPLLPEFIFQRICEQYITPIEIVDWQSALELAPFYLQLGCAQQLVKPYSKLPFDKTYAKLLLDIWSEADQRDLFIQRFLLPKLSKTAHEVVIDPADQKIDRLEEIMEWRALLSDHWMTLVLKEGGLFLCLRSALYHWLHSLLSNSSKKEGYQEIAEWYLAWKHFLFSPTAESEFRALLKIMEHFLNVDAGIEPTIKSVDEFML